MIITCFYSQQLLIQSKLNFFPENLKNKVKKPEVKNHSCRETCQSVEVSLVQGYHSTLKPEKTWNF